MGGMGSGERTTAGLRCTRLCSCPTEGFLSSVDVGGIDPL